MFWQFLDRSVNSLFVTFTMNGVSAQSSYLFWVFVLIGLLMSISIHEWAHAYSAHRLGDDTARNEDRMNINPLNHFDALGLGLILFTFFGYGKPVPVNPNNFANPARDMMRVSLAGPVSNFLIAAFCGFSFLALKPFVQPGDLNSIIGIINGFLSTLIYSLGMIGYFNIGLMVFNMLPIHPLDGRKIWGYVHYSINEFLIRYVDPNAIVILIIAILPVGGIQVVSLLTLPFFLFYTLVFGVRFY